MKIEQFIDVKDAISKGEKLEFIFIRNLSELFIGKCSDYLEKNGESFIEKNQNEIVELSFFDNNTEIRIVNRAKAYENIHQKQCLIKLIF